MNEDAFTALGSAAAIENHRVKLLEGDRNAMKMAVRYLRGDLHTYSPYHVCNDLIGTQVLAMLEAALLQHPDTERAA